MPSNENPVAWRLGLTATVLLLASALQSCTAADTGRLQPDETAAMQFSELQILADHNYYYFGRPGAPEAILAVQKSFNLISNLWTPVAFTPSMLNQWIYRMNFRYRGRRTPTGFRIVGPNGERIGLWYSPWNWTTVIVHDDNTVEIYPPQVDDPVDGESRPGKRRSR